jgi:hypothetical protein
MSSRLYLRTLAPMLNIMNSFVVGQNAIVSSKGETALKPSILDSRDQNDLARILGRLLGNRFYVVVSTVNCHHYHRDQILTETELNEIRNNTDIALYVDSTGKWI